MILRGGAFKPRTTPYSFQGLGRKGVTMLEALRKTRTRQHFRNYGCPRR